MKQYLFKRFIYMVVIMLIMSFFSFIIVQLPPGDFIASYVANLEQQLGSAFDPAIIDSIRAQYGVDQPMMVQYFKWMSGMLSGDFGQSFEWKMPVAQLIWDRMPDTVLISVLTLVFTYIIAVPIGIYSARHQYTLGDYVFSIIGFVGLAIPSFFLALVLMYWANVSMGMSVGGLQSPEFANAGWSLARIWDFLKHLPIPVFAIGIAGMANIIRVMRATLLDELKRPYVVAARARGLKENSMIYRYPVRVALNPIISSIGSILPGIVSGATVTAIVLDIPTVGSLLYKALLSQDMFLAGSCILMLTLMTIVGTFLSDILLVLIDPRIRLTA